jgi:peptidyl-prolyl cis-trans isomerase SurA
MTVRIARFRSTQALALAAVSALALQPFAALAQQAPAPLASPRYQSPGVAPVQSPQPQLNLPALPVTPAISADGTVVEDVVVRVNDQIISRSDVERAQQQLVTEARQAGATDISERQKNLLRDLIDQQLLLSRGKELSITGDTETVRRLDEIRKQNKLDSMEDLEKAARAQGVSFEDFKLQIRNSIITSTVVRDEVSRKLQMTHADEVKYYEAHKQEFTQPEQIRLSEILVPAPATADDATLAQAQKKAEDLAAKIKGGADFAEVAKANSGGPTAAQGGYLGYFKRGDATLAQVFQDKTFPLKAGEFTEPIRTRQGFVILQVTEHQEAGIPPLEKIEQQVQEAMYQEQMGPALRTYLTHLREDAYVDIKPGFVDSGATSSETKPLFSAYTPPAPKKKVVPAKQRFDRRGAAATPAAGATAVRVSTPTPAPAMASAQLDKKGRPKKIKREKIRYGQAPRTALPTALGETPTETATATGVEGTAIAPGTAIEPVAPNNTVATNDDPLAPVAPVQKKTRFSARAATFHEEKVQAQQKKVADKVAATPNTASTDEQMTQKQQLQALGLNGDTATKKKKKRQKGEAKERLTNKPVEKAAPLVENQLPDKKTGLPTEQKPTADQTTLAPANQPAPSSTTPTPATPGQPSTTSNASAPLR